MLFTAPTFLWLFLPAMLAAHTSVVRRSIPLANAVLLIGSLFFYVWGSGGLVALLLVSVGIDHVAASLAHRGREAGSTRIRKTGVAISVVGNLGMLGWFKYAGFLAQTIDDVSDLLGGSAVGVPQVVLPIGISFFTFQSMSYTLDVAAGRTAPFRNPLRLLLYVSLFPQLIAGPIVRVGDIADSLSNRSVDGLDLARGFERFVWGLAKKVLVADSVAPLVDASFAADPTSASAWIAASAFAVQIYFDFSGYSDMAIGIGRMLGFRFPENFARPYASATITDFWRRWHITLSSWFRDYLYIPLGGNRGGQGRTYRNLGIVFVVTGIWHGAAWTFLIWGVWHGAALLIERRRGITASSTGLGLRIWTWMVVLTGWVWFRAADAGDAAALLRSMILPEGGLPVAVQEALTPITVLALVGGLLSAVMPRRINPRAWLQTDAPAAMVVRSISFIGVLAAVSLRVVAETFSPFLYFRF